MTALLLSLEGLPDRAMGIEREVVPEARHASARALLAAREERLLVGHTSTVWSAAFSPDGTRIVTASADKTARLWEAATGRLLATLEGHRDTVRHAAFSPDGARVVTASGDRTARLWEVATGRRLATLEGHKGYVSSAALSPDGARILTASYDKTARLWEAATGRLLAIIEGHKSTVESAAFSPDGGADGVDLILTASADETARLWRVPHTIEALVNAAKDRAPRCLTQAQRKQYFLPPAPPLWCVERRLWPYHGAPWQDWLAKRKAWLASTDAPDPELPKEQ